MKSTRVLMGGAVLTATMMLAAGVSQAAVPSIMSYQGKLTDSTGKLVAEGAYEMRFSIHDADSGGSALWTETWEAPSTVPVTNGMFSVLLGARAPIVLPFDESYWLGVEVKSGGSWEALSPRQSLASAPYAMRAKAADDAVSLDGRVPGTGAGDIVALDDSGKLPALDGSNLNNVVRIPVVLGITPDSANPGYTPFTATITGGYFQSISQARIGSVALTEENVLSTTSMTATVPSGIPEGVFGVSVSNIDLAWGTGSGLFLVNTRTPTPTPTATPTATRTPTATATPFPGSCKAIKDSNPSAPDGVYVIDPDGPGTGEEPFGAYCDMTTDGGGWTLAGFRGSQVQDALVFSRHDAVHSAFDEDQQNGSWCLLLADNKINNAAAYGEMAITFGSTCRPIGTCAYASFLKFDGTYRINTNWSTAVESGSYKWKCTAGASYNASSIWHQLSTQWAPWTGTEQYICSVYYHPAVRGWNPGNVCNGSCADPSPGYIWVR